MEENTLTMNQTIEEVDYNKDYRSFRIWLLIFLIGQFFWTLSATSFGATFKFLPHWLTLFQAFEILGHPLVLIALIGLRKHNKQFLFALITMGLYLTTAFIYAACLTSTDPYYLAIGKGMDVSKRILMFLMYIYTFQGCYQFFKKHDMKKGMKTAKITCFVFLSIYSVYFISSIIKTFKFIMYNSLLNRIFTYTSWLSQLSVYVYAFVIVLIVVIYFFRITKERGKKDES